MVGILPLLMQNFAVLVWIQQVHINNTPSYIVQYNHMLLKVASAIRKKQVEFNLHLLNKKMTV